MPDKILLPRPLGQPNFVPQQYIRPAPSAVGPTLRTKNVMTASFNRPPWDSPWPSLVERSELLEDANKAA